MGQVSVFSLWLVINQRQSLVAYLCLEILEIELKFKLFFFFFCIFTTDMNENKISHS